MRAAHEAAAARHRRPTGHYSFALSPWLRSSSSRRQAKSQSGDTSGGGGESEAHAEADVEAPGLCRDATARVSEAVSAAPPLGEEEARLSAPPSPSLFRHGLRPKQSAGSASSVALGSLILGLGVDRLQPSAAALPKPLNDYDLDSIYQVSLSQVSLS